MSETLKGQVVRSAAAIYEEFFVPALFAEWASRVADAAQLAPGQRVLDVACGTGVLAREADRRVAPSGSVVGLDRSEGMLAVARQKSARVLWKSGLAEALPFPDGSFDAVVSQFGLMFFDDRTGALREMRRVLKPGGRLAVAVWDALENNAGYADMVALLHRLFGQPMADELRAPFVLGDVAMLRTLFADAGMAEAEIQTRSGTAHFPSIEVWVRTDVKGWTLADLIDDEQYRLLQRESVAALGRYVTEDGTVAFASPAHIVIAHKPG